MDVFEERLAQLTSKDDPDVLGAIGVVFDNSGNILYTHSAGRRLLKSDAASIDHDTTICLGSAGKVVAHIALQGLVEAGVLKLNDPVFSLIPELESLPIISADKSSPHGFNLRPRKKPITFRQLLLHTSGLASGSHPLVQAWQDAVPKRQFPKDTPTIVKDLSFPLIFEPGEGWYYGESSHWMQLVFERIGGIWGNETGQRYVDHMREHIFKPLGMTSSDYYARPDLSERRLELVKRSRDGTLVAAGDNAVGGLRCSISDFQKLLVELISPDPKLLTKSSLDMFHEPAFASSSEALRMLRADTEDYEMPAGIPKDMSSPPVNYSFGGLVAQDQLLLSGLPPGTVTWNGSPNVVWAVHREKGTGMLFATQLLPVDDEKVVDVMMEFFKAAVLKHW